MEVCKIGICRLLFFLHFNCNETWIVGVEVSSLALGVYCGQLGATKNGSKSLYFPLCFRVNANIWERAFSACCVHVCLHMKASGEAHLSTRQHIKAFSHWSERTPALELLYLSPVCLETTKRCVGVLVLLNLLFENTMG